MIISTDDQSIDFVFNPFRSGANVCHKLPNHTRNAAKTNQKPDLETNVIARSSATVWKPRTRASRTVSRKSWKRRSNAIVENDAVVMRTCGNTVEQRRERPSVHRPST